MVVWSEPVAGPVLFHLAMRCKRACFQRATHLPGDCSTRWARSECRNEGCLGMCTVTVVDVQKQLEVKSSLNSEEGKVQEILQIYECPNNAGRN